MKNAVFWDVMPFRSCKNRHFRGKYCHHQGEKIGELGKTLAVTSMIFVSLMMEAIRSSETTALKRATRRHIPENGILHSRRRENLTCIFIVYKGIL
jgi:hypothetical protein